VLKFPYLSVFYYFGSDFLENLDTVSQTVISFFGGGFHVGAGGHDQPPVYF
jgi:hypothetical protein